MKRRTLLVIVLLLLVILIGVATSYVVRATQAPPQVVHDAEEDREALIPSPHSSSGSCGVERWAVKTGTDADVGSINLQSTTQTTIASLISLPTPSTLPASNRIKPTETTVFQLHDTLTEYKLENDSDYHLVLSDGSNTMIVEIPDPTCVGSSSPLLSGIQNARAKFDARYPNVTSSFQTANVPVTVTGVGFFDFLHGQTGVAPNGIELHAILDVQFGNGGSPTPTPVATPTPIPTVVNTPTATPTGTPVTGNLIQNGGFETNTGWTYSGQNVPARTTTNAHSGSYSLRVGTISGQQGDSIASQAVTIPGSATSASLSFYYWPATNDKSTYAWQEADIVDGSGKVLQQLFKKTSNDNTWLPLTFDLSSYAGQTIKIQFLDHENSNGYSYYAYMYVDDVTLTVH